MKRRFPFSAAAFFFVLLFLAGVVVKRSLGGPPTKPTAAEFKRADREATPKKGSDEKTVVPAGNYTVGNGLIEPAERETKLSAPLPGRVQSILVKEGDFVEGGTAVVELDHGVEKAALDAAEGDLRSAEADFARVSRGLRKEEVEAAVAEHDAAKARSELSRAVAERAKTLSTGGAITAEELDRATRQAESDEKSLAAADARKRAALAGSRAEDVLSARARVAAATGRRDQAKAALERLTIRAPIAGQILQVKIRAGEYYNPQGSEPLLVMGDTRTLRVRMDVDERDIGKMSVGKSAFCVLNAFPGKRFSAKVVEVGKRMGRKNIRTDDPVERIDTKVLEVILELEAPEGLVPGLRVTSYVEK